jgi:Transposase IS116/IS110/IS902 family
MCGEGSWRLGPGARRRIVAAVKAGMSQKRAAATFIAAVGEIGRFPSTRKLAGYLGLDPRVSQSGSSPAAHGRISKQGSTAARHALVEASWSVVRQPGPIRAFYQRARGRRGHQVAIVAAARKLACLFWCLLTREEDYACREAALRARALLRVVRCEPQLGGIRGARMPRKAAVRDKEPIPLILFEPGRDRLQVTAAQGLMARVIASSKLSWAPVAWASFQRRSP